GRLPTIAGSASLEPALGKKAGEWWLPLQSPFWDRSRPYSRLQAATPVLFVQHRQVQPLLFGAVDGDLVAGIGVAHHTGTRIVDQNAGETPVRVGRKGAKDEH